MRAGWSRFGYSSTTTVDARTPSGVGPCSGAVSVTSVASTGAPASGRWRHRDALTDHRRRRRPPLAERLRQLRRRRPAGPPREARAHATSSTSPRLAPPSCSTTRRVSRRSARPSTGSSEAPPELRRLRLVFEVFLRERAHALGRVDQQAARLIAVGLATALCRRFHLVTLTIRVLELRRCNDWAQLQNRVTGPLNRSVSCEGPLAELAPRYEVGTSRPDSLRPPPARFEARG